ncbi:MAG TPA: YafY family protein [Blastocatellia bacterium]|nr:YafY family protein [Blastocatellia bacterium]
MNRTDRLLALVLKLQCNGRQRAEDLASAFETSKRTIYRDIQALSEAGVPVVALPGQGYSLMAGYFLPPLSFTTDEATMLLMGADFVAKSFDAEYRGAAHSAAAKIEAVLPEKLRDEVRYLQDSICFVPISEPDRPGESEMLQQLRRAIVSRKTARFRYHTRFTEDGKGKQRVREADPYGMLNAGGTWYMVAHCHLRGDTRIFRLDRVADLLILDRRFERPPAFKMTEPEPREQRKIVVRALFDKEIAPWVREARSYFVVDMEEKPEGLLVMLRVRMESEIVQWLLGWGGSVRVLEPDSLRRRLVEEGKRIIENNRNL